MKALLSRHIWTNVEMLIKKLWLGKHDRFAGDGAVVGGDNNGAVVGGDDDWLLWQ